MPHECVAYDGCFYPPALAEFLADPEARIREVEAGTGGFYERFYSQLGLSEQARAHEA